jgi:hypothetical protein
LAIRKSNKPSKDVCISFSRLRDELLDVVDLLAGVSEPARRIRE